MFKKVTGSVVNYSERGESENGDASWDAIVGVQEMAGLGRAIAG